VIAITGSRLPERRFRSQKLRHVVPVCQAVRLQCLPDSGQAYRVIEHHACGGGLLAVVGKFRPHLCDRRVQVQMTSLVQQVGTQGHCRLGTGENHRYGVLTPRGLLRCIRHAAPDVYHLAPFMGQAQGGSYLITGPEILQKRIHNRLKTRGVAAFDEATRYFLFYVQHQNYSKPTLVSYDCQSINTLG